MRPDFADKTDEELMLAYQEGDLAAFNALYHRIAGQLYGYLRRRVQSHLVDDVFQAVMAKFHQSRALYRPTFPVMPWAFTICRTVMVDTLRQQARRQETPEEMEQFEAPSESPDSALDVDLANARILTAAQKEAVSLRFEKDLSFEEIARRLDTTPANARQLVSRALRKLRTLVRKKEGA